MVERSPFFFGSLDRSSGSSSPYTGYLPSGIEYYIPPSLRRPVLEAGRMGYEVLDNIFGFDDARVTAGEELGRALREDPLGVGEAVAGGIYGAVKDPIGTGRAVIEDIGGSFSRIQDMPDPRYATREEMGQGAADLFATAPFLSGPVVAGRLGLRGLGSVLPGEDVVTSVRENPLAALADRMTEETTALGVGMLQDDGMLRVPVTRNGEPAYIGVDPLTYRSPYGAQFFSDDMLLRANLDQFADILEMGLSTEDLEGAFRDTFFDRGLGADMFSEFDQQVPNELRQFSPDILRALFQQRVNPSPDELAAFDRAMAGARLDIRDADDQIANQLDLEEFPIPEADFDEFPDRVELRALLADRLVDDPTRNPTNPWRHVLDAEDMREQVDAEFAAEQARIVDIMETLENPDGYTDEEVGRFLEEFRPPVADFDEFPDDDIDMSVYSQGPYNQYQYDLTETYLSDSLGPAQTALAGQTKFNSVEELLSALKSKRAKPAELALRGITPQGLGAFVDADGKIDLTDARVEALLAKNPVKVHVKTGANAAYERNFTPGGQSYSETILTLENPDLRSGAGGLEGSMSHFGSVQDGGPSIVHFRTAEFPVVEGGTSFHLGEIQSDVAQTLRKVKKRRAVQQDLLDIEDADERLQFIADNYRSFPGGDFVEFEVESLERYLDLPKEQREALIQGGLNSDDRLWDSIDMEDWQPEAYLRGDDISDPVERAREVQQRLERNKRDSFYLKKETFENVMGVLDTLSDLESSGPLPKTNVETAGLQGLYTTEKTTDLAIKSAFDQIMANPRVTHFTLGTGRMAHDMTGGALEGQQAFYDGIVPKQVNKVLEQLEKTSGLDMPRLDFVTIRGDAGEYKVPAFEITDNFRNAIREYGLPMFRKGGRVVAPSFLGLGSLGREYL